MNRLNRMVASDADGVFIDWPLVFMRFLNYKLKRNMRYEDIVSFRFDQLFGTSLDHMIDLAAEFDATVDYTTMPAIEGSLEKGRIIQEQFGLVIVTARPDRVGEATRYWFDCHLPGVEVYFSLANNNPFSGTNDRESKLEISQKLKARCLIDDNMHEFEDWPHDELTGICLAQTWNVSVNHETPRLNWDQVMSWLLGT